MENIKNLAYDILNVPRSLHALRPTPTAAPEVHWLPSVSLADQREFCDTLWVLRTHGKWKKLLEGQKIVTDCSETFRNVILCIKRVAGMSGVALGALEALMKKWYQTYRYILSALKSFCTSDPVSQVKRCHEPLRTLEIKGLHFRITPFHGILMKSKTVKTFGGCLLWNFHNKLVVFAGSYSIFSPESTFFLMKKKVPYQRQDQLF